MVLDLTMFGIEWERLLSIKLSRSNSPGSLHQDQNT